MVEPPLDGEKVTPVHGWRFAMLMNMLLDVEDDPGWHNDENEDEDAGKTSNYAFPHECLDKLLISLGGDTIVPIALELFLTFLADLKWKGIKPH